MIAYDLNSLDNRQIQEQAKIASAKNLMTSEEHQSVLKAFPVKFYSPNVFIQIGLFILTVVIATTGFGFCLLITGAGATTAIAVLSLFYSVILYVALEFIVRKNHHYNSGIDEALIWLSAGFLLFAVNTLIPKITSSGEALLCCLISALYVIRFVSATMSAVLVGSFLALIFYMLIPVGDVTKAIMPFVISAISLGIYFLARKVAARPSFRYYRHCLLVIELLSLITVYIALNYFVVREISNEMFNLHLQPGQSMPAGWIFWAATIIIPLICIFYGIRRKEAGMLRIGLLLAAVGVFTVRYYHPIFPVEIALTIGGVLLVIIAYLVSRYLDTPRSEITSKVSNDPALPGMLQLEALAMAEVFRHTAQPPADQALKFGGGSGGGAGATGNY